MDTLLRTKVEREEERGEEGGEELGVIKESEHRGLKVRSRKMAAFNLLRIMEICVRRPYLTT